MKAYATDFELMKMGRQGLLDKKFPKGQNRLSLQKTKMLWLKAVA